MDYDPTQYHGSAPHYLIGRPPYSDQLGVVLQQELGLDGTGHLLDVGCGPGVLAVQLRPLFDQVTAIDPDPDMITEARKYAEGSGAVIDFRQARAEDLPTLDLPQQRLVSFGQSFHRVDRLLVAETVYDLLVPGGAMIMIGHEPDARPVPDGPGDPPIPHDEIQQLITDYLGAERRSGSRPASSYTPERFEVTLTRTRFKTTKTVYAPGRPDITRDIDGVISGYLSMSYAAPHLFGDRLDDFVADLRELLRERTPTGRFWDWPGDTGVLIARR